MSLCTGDHQTVATPRSPRSRGPWTAKAVLEALTDAMCRFLDTHYFAADLTHDEMVVNTKAEELYMDEDDIMQGKKGGKEIEEWEDEGDFFAPENIKADIKLAAYEHVLLETPPLPVAEIVVTPRPVAEARPADIPTSAPPPAKKAKAKKAKKAKSPKAANVPRALAVDAAPKAKAPLRKMAPARKPSAKPVSVRV